MSLTASMWTSVSGLLVHGEKMNVVGNNISNVNTVGFKAQRMDFEDFVYQYVGTASGMGQVGRGTGIGIIMNDFSQAAFETTTETTDIAISGNGFFCVKPKNSNTDYYTRAGNFRFDSDGFLVDPHGYVLQGWKVSNEAQSLAATSGSTSSAKSSIIGTGTPQDVKLDTFSCPPKHTNSMTLAVNLDSAKGNDKTTDEDDPFFSLLKAWDATPDALGKITPLGSQSYAYSNTIEVFDEGGKSHKLTIYFDRVEQTVDTNIQGVKENEILWEYIVTMDPAEDVRNFNDPANPAGAVPDKYKGLLMSGTLTFDSSGQIKDMSSYVPTSQDMADLNTWVQAPLSNNGYPVLCPNFSGRDGASTAWDPAQSKLNPKADGYLIEMNLGLRSTTPTWGGNAPATIADWRLDLTGEFKEYKVEGMAVGTVLKAVDKGTDGPDPTATPPAHNGTPPANGVVGANGIVYEQLQDDGNAQPAGQVAHTDGYVYQQKSVAIDGLDTHEAEDSGWVYAQEVETDPGTLTGDYYHWQNANGDDIYENKTTGVFYRADGTTLSSTSGLVAIADTNSPVRSDRGVATGDPVLKYDANGDPIEKTQTRVYTGMGTKAERQNTTSTSFTNNTGNNFYERFAAQDGYTYGELRYVTVSEDGVLSGAYSNGVTLELFQITLYDFSSKQNLRREGGNLFTETRESGLPISGAAGTGSFGTTKSNSLEQSNVDLAREFVNMITTQRGFQANSKSITTVDTMLENVIQMKR